MSLKSRKSTSWFARFGKVFQGQERRVTRTKGHRGLRFESLETRSLLSATVLPTISGVIYQDLGGGTLNPSDPRAANVTVNLFRDGGDGVFEGKNSGDDTLAASATSNASGVYSFTNISAGTYFVQEVGVPGIVVPSGTGVQEVIVTSDDTQPSPQMTIDSFGSTSQFVSGSLHGGKTGTSSMSTTDAIGDHRNLYVQLTSSVGSISLGANSDVPGVLDYATGSTSNGNFWVNWDGSNSSPATLNPTGLGQIDLTSAGAATGITLSAGVDHDSGSLKLKVYSDGGDWSYANIPIQDTTDGAMGDSIYVPFSSFSVGAGSGANFTTVGAIQLGISGVNASDGQIGPIQTAGSTVFVENLANTPLVDLSVVKSAQPNPVTAGGQLTYTFTTTNNGPSNATGVMLSDVLPAGETYVSSTSSQGMVSNSNGSLSVQLGSLATGATATTTVIVSVDASASGTLTNTVTVSGNQPDSNPNNNTSTVATPIVNTIDLAEVKSVSSTLVKSGDQLTYTLTTTNNGPSNATGVKVVDTLPAGFEYMTASGQHSATITGQALTLYIGNLAVGASNTITIGGLVQSFASGTLFNTATVSGDQTDSNLSNNTSSVVSTVSVQQQQQATVDLKIVKTAVPNPVKVGGTLTYTLVVTNNSLTTATGVKVVDMLPAGFAYTTASGQNSATIVGNTLTLYLGTLAAQGQDTITIGGIVTAAAASAITNTAVVSEDQPDLNPSDNTSSVITTVVQTGVPSKYWYIV